MKKILLSLLLISSTFAKAQDSKVQCKGIKADKTECTRKVDAAKGYCFQHDPSAKRCTGTTKAGTPCKMLASKGSDYCHIHQPK